MFHLAGPTLRGVTASNISYSIGLLLFPVLLGFAIIYRAKTLKGVLIGHITLFALSGSLILTELHEVRESELNGFFKGCRYKNAFVTASTLTDSEKDDLCNCTGEAVIGKLTRYTMSYNFFYKKPPLPELNSELMNFVLTKVEACTPSI